MRLASLFLALVLASCSAGPSIEAPPAARAEESGPTPVPVRERLSINDGWRFTKGDPPGLLTSLLYDVRPDDADAQDDRPADAQPTEAVNVEAAQRVLKPWILPTGNDFLDDPAERHERPAGHPGADVAYVQRDFDDGAWARVDLPHDWAIEGPWLEEGPYGGMGRLPSWGIGWYRKELDIPASDVGRSIFLDVDGAMSYATVWLNEQLVGGWPFGYASWRVDLTPYVEPGGENQLVIRLDNPPNSSRWYPGGGLYRNVWLVKTNPVHVAQWGTAVTTPEVSEAVSTIELAVTIDNDGDTDAAVEIVTEVFALDSKGERTDKTLARVDPLAATVAAGESATVEGSVRIERPRLWGPPPTQTPNLYEAVTTVSRDGVPVDRYETRFGIRDLAFDPDRGVVVNGEHVYLQGVNQHHDLGALGAAFNVRAAERQLEVLREMGVNAIRMAHNPPAPELLELTDRMGFLVADETFDVWERRKTPLDAHLIFPDWHEQDTRALVRRDRNHPSVIMWSIGNEVGEQYTDEEGAALARRLHEIVEAEDPTRPTTASMNYAKPDMPFPAATDLINLNYQGEGIRDAPAYSHLQGITTPPLYPAFREAFPDKVIVSSENAAAVSSRGTYVFPVAGGISAPVSDSTGGDPVRQVVSAYELYTAPFGSSADKVFRSLDQHPYVGGGFVWSGWDYLGEPTPYYDARSSYFGVIDLAGFPKDRFYLYQSQWRPDHPMAHVLPHWTWPERVGEVTPVHVFTSGDEAELFLNGRSLGRKRMGAYEVRLRWDDVVYEPGTLEVVAYKDGEEWARDRVETAGVPAALAAEADRIEIAADGRDLSFVTVRVVDAEGRTVPDAANRVRFEVEGPGEIVATDNGDPTSFEPFQSSERAAFSGLVLAIVRFEPGATGLITVTARGDGLREAAVQIRPVRAPVETGGAWLGTWGTAVQLTEPHNLPPVALAGTTLRQVVRPSVGGERVRLHLSNAFGDAPVVLSAAHLAASRGDGAIDPATDAALTFGGRPGVTIPPGGAVTSDPLAFALAPLADVAITVQVEAISDSLVTGHPGSRTTSYVVPGAAASAPAMADAARTDHWYVIAGLDVERDGTAVAIIGDSITDGRGSGTNEQNRWPDELARRLQSDPRTEDVAVLNMGIGGNCVLRACLGPSALDRFERDVLARDGVAWLVVLEGVNDIGGAAPEHSAQVAQDLIAAYRQMIDRAHQHGIRVYGATILPFGGSFYDSPEHEAARQTVNAWIRTGGAFDAVIDLDAALRDPEHPTRLREVADTGDHLHPNEAGHRMMAEAVDLALFAE